MQPATDTNGFDEQPALTKQNLSFWTLTQQRRRKKRAALPKHTLSFTRSNLVFGDVTESVQSEIVLRLTNNSLAGVTVSAINISGANAGDFSAGTALPQTIAAGGFKNFSMLFTPSALGARTANFSIVTTAGTFSFWASGNGV